MKRTRLATAAIAAILASGCATGRSIDSPFASTQDSEASNKIRIEVRNNNWNEVRLFAVSGGSRRRLGTVGGNQDAVYNIDWNFSLPLVMEIDLVAGPSCTTRSMRVDPGDTVQLQIESAFHLTRACRRIGDAQPYSR